MKKLTSKLIVMVCLLLTLFTSCEKEETNGWDQLVEIYDNTYTYTDTITGENITYEFRMDGMCNQDNNDYYHLTLTGSEEYPQTTHKFGAYVTNIDFWGLPTQVIWSCDAFWSYQDQTVPIVNGTSFADPNVDSVYCMMAPVIWMQGATVTIHGQAWFEEGDIILKDSINFIFE